MNRNLKPRNDYLDNYENFKRFATNKIYDAVECSDKEFILKKSKEELDERLLEVGAITQSRVMNTPQVYLISAYYKDLENLVPVENIEVNNHYIKGMLARIDISDKALEKYSNLFENTVVCIDTWSLYIHILKKEIYNEFSDRLVEIKVDPLEFIKMTKFDGISEMYINDIFKRQKENFLDKNLSVDDLMNLNDDSFSILCSSLQMIFIAGNEFGFGSELFESALRDFNKTSLPKRYSADTKDSLISNKATMKL